MYEYKLIQRCNEGWLRISDEDMVLIEEGQWEIVFLNIDKSGFYAIQLKRLKP